MCRVRVIRISRSGVTKSIDGYWSLLVWVGAATELAVMAMSLYPYLMVPPRLVPCLVVNSSEVMPFVDMF